MMGSLQGRLAAGLAISLVSLFLILWLLISQAIRVLAEDYIASRLEHDATSLLAALTVTSPSNPVVDMQKIDAIYHRPFSGHYYQISVNKTVLHSRSLWDQDLTIPFLEPGKSQRLHQAGPQQQPLLIYVAGFKKHGVQLTLAIAEDLSALEADIREFQTYFAISALSILLILIVLQYVIIQRSLKPLERVRHEIHALESGKLEQLSHDVPAEIKPLVSEINHLLTVLAQRLRRSRNTLGDLAHALKTPLTLLHRISGETALTKAPEIRETLETQTETMQRLMERALRRARLAGDGPPGANFSVNDDTQALIDTLRRMHHEKEFILEIDKQSHISVPLDREDMLELLGNLLDNAGKWARHRVNLKVQVDHNLNCEIEDDGTGVSDEELTQLTQRGLRLDESAEGYGLGLAIVRDIVDQYSGDIHLTRSEELGGLKVSLSIPITTP